MEPPKGCSDGMVFFPLSVIQAARHCSLDPSVAIYLGALLAWLLFNILVLIRKAGVAWSGLSAPRGTNFELPNEVIDMLHNDDDIWFDVVGIDTSDVHARGNEAFEMQTSDVSRSLKKAKQQAAAAAKP